MLFYGDNTNRATVVYTSMPISRGPLFPLKIRCDSQKSAKIIKQCPRFYIMHKTRISPFVTFDPARNHRVIGNSDFPSWFKKKTKILLIRRPPAYMNCIIAGKILKYSLHTVAKTEFRVHFHSCSISMRNKLSIRQNQSFLKLFRQKSKFLFARKDHLHCI